MEHQGRQPHQPEAPARDGKDFLAGASGWCGWHPFSCELPEATVRACEAMGTGSELAAPKSAKSGCREVPVPISSQALRSGPTACPSCPSVSVSSAASCSTSSVPSCSNPECLHSPSKLLSEHRPGQSAQRKRARRREPLSLRRALFATCKHGRRCRYPHHTIIIPIPARISTQEKRHLQKRSETTSRAPPRLSQEVAPSCQGLFHNAADRRVRGDRREEAQEGQKGARGKRPRTHTIGGDVAPCRSCCVWLNWTAPGGLP